MKLVSEMITEKILVVDDEKHTADAFKEILENMGFNVDCAYSAKSGLEKILNNELYFLIISDLRLGEDSGVDLINDIKKIRKSIFAIIITAYGTVTNAVDCIKMGIEDYLSKPVDFEKLKITVNGIAEKHLMNKEIINLKEKIYGTNAFRNIIGQSRQMKEIFGLITKVSKSNSTVLLRGKSGTGKELVARAIHYQSNRSDQSLIPINCAALPEHLLESELFGHKKGAFTGAIADRKGKFEEAGQGTIFLDEIGDMSINLQTKFLRVLQERCFEPVGCNSTIQLKARIIASTNRDLEEAIKNKTFREDLYFRLNVIPIYLPPLCERENDVILLANFFLEKFCSQNSIILKKFNKEAQEILKAYFWPGNVRELENLVERLVVIAEEELIDASHLSSIENYEISDNLDKKNINHSSLMDEYERKVIEYALNESGNNKTKAAKLLEISLRQLHYKIKKHGLS